MLAVTLAASGIAHDAAYIFARRRMTRARMLRISLFALLALIFILISLKAIAASIFFQILSFNVKNSPVFFQTECDMLGNQKIFIKKERWGMLLRQMWNMERRS